MDSLFFWLSKLVWFLIAPGSWILLLVLASLLALVLNRLLLAKILVITTALILLMIALFPVGEWLISPLETRFTVNPELPDRIDGIVVLSGAVSPYRSAAWQQPVVGDASERLMAFVELGRRYPDARMVFTGGTGSLATQDYGAASVADKVIAMMGGDVSRVMFEGNARNTYENVINTKPMVEPQNGEIWIMITSAFHMPRSVGIFCRAGWPVVAYPVDFYSSRGRLLRVEMDVSENLRVLNTAVKEWVGLLAYWLTGKTNRLLSNGC